jgi:hypothetical protein
MSDGAGSLDVEREDEWLRGVGEEGESEMGLTSYDEPRRRREESKMFEEGYGRISSPEFDYEAWDGGKEEEVVEQDGDDYGDDGGGESLFVPE